MKNYFLEKVKNRNRPDTQGSMGSTSKKDKPKYDEVLNVLGGGN